MLVEVQIPLRHNTSSGYAKVERRVGDWAVTAAGAAITLDGAAIAAAVASAMVTVVAPAAVLAVLVAFAMRFSDEVMEPASEGPAGSLAAAAVATTVFTCKS